MKKIVLRNSDLEFDEKETVIFRDGDETFRVSFDYDKRGIVVNKSSFSGNEQMTVSPYSTNQILIK